MKKIREYMAIQRAEDKRKEQMTIYEINDPRLTIRLQKVVESLKNDSRLAHKDPLSRANVVMCLCGYNGEMIIFVKSTIVKNILMLNDCNSLNFKKELDQG